MDLGVVYDFPVRLRIGVAQPLKPSDRAPSRYVAAGAAF